VGCCEECLEDVNSPSQMEASLCLRFALPVCAPRIVPTFHIIALGEIRKVISYCNRCMITLQVNRSTPSYVQKVPLSLLVLTFKMEY